MGAGQGGSGVSLVGVVPVAADVAAQRGASEPVLPVVRSGVAVLLLLALANGAFLYIVPSQAEAHYAWAVKPASAAGMGAGYLAGLLATALAVRARDWRSFRTVVPGFFALGVTLLAATLIHADRFRWGYPPTWIWTGVYASIPPLAVYFWRMQAVAARGAVTVPRDGRLASLRPLSVAFGLLSAIVGVSLFVAPGGLLGEWGWTITPLLGRVFAGWYLLAAGTLLCLAWSFRRPAEVPIPCATVALWSALTLLIPLLHGGDVHTTAALFWPWIAFHAGMLVACSWLAARSLRLIRIDGEARSSAG
jgi:hypothetical protein